jgi:hypothetical protein
MNNVFTKQWWKENLQLSDEELLKDDSFEKKLEIIKDFINFTLRELGLKETQKGRKGRIKLSNDREKARKWKTFGTFDPTTETTWIYVGNRNCADILRTIAHELVHYKQRLNNQELDGSTGSDTENEANSVAGEIMRKYGQKNPLIYESLIKEIGDGEIYPINNFTSNQEEDGTVAIVYNFNTPKNKYTVSFYGDIDSRIFIEFGTTGDDKNENSSETGENVSIKVLSTIVYLVKNFINEFQPYSVYIDPIPSPNEILNYWKGKPFIRTRIYKNYINKNLPSNYNVEERTNRIIITKND